MHKSPFLTSDFGSFPNLFCNCPGKMPKMEVKQDKLLLHFFVLLDKLV